MVIVFSQLPKKSLTMAYILESNNVRIGGEAIFDAHSIEFKDGLNLGPIPTLYDQKNSYIEPVNNWFIHLKSSKRLEDLSSYSRALKHYWSFLESRNLSWDYFPRAKGLKPTYRYRNDELLEKATNGELAYSTASTYMSHIIQFYLWAAREKYYEISENHKPFEIEFVQARRDDVLAHMMPKFLIQTTDLRIRVPRDSTNKNIRSLKPLSQTHLRTLGLSLNSCSIEMRLICLLSAQCGLRAAETAGFTLMALNQAVKRLSSRTHYEITIGPNNGVPTKFNKTRIIEITEQLLSDLIDYSISERRLNRLNKMQAKCKSLDEQTDEIKPILSNSIQSALLAAKKFEPLFISQQGNPQLPGSLSSRFSELRREIINSGTSFDYKFHDLRCSYATYRLHSLLEAGIEPADALSLLMSWMGHKNESTVWKYLRYLKRKEAIREKISILDSIMNEALKEAESE